MVNPKPERLPYPHWSLERICELAAEGRVRYAGTRVTYDIDNLGLAPDDVCDCLKTLDASCFQHSERYVDGGAWHDVYLRAWAPQRRKPDDLYIKLRLDHGCVTVELCSFHQTR
jgi:hypothetical protein